MVLLFRSSSRFLYYIFIHKYEIFCKKSFSKYFEMEEHTWYGGLSQLQKICDCLFTVYCHFEIFLKIFFTKKSLIYYLIEYICTKPLDTFWALLFFGPWLINKKTYTVLKLGREEGYLIQTPRPPPCSPIWTHGHQIAGHHVLRRTKDSRPHSYIQMSQSDQWPIKS